MERVLGHSRASRTSQFDSASLKTLRNTYRLLAMTLGFSAIVAFATAAMSLPHPGLLISLGGFFGLLFLTHKTANSGWGLVSVFALTGFMGYTIGPILNAYLATVHGSTLVAMSAGTTAAAFLGLSAYARSENALDYRRILFGPWGLLLADSCAFPGGFGRIRAVDEWSDYL